MVTLTEKHNLDFNILTCI